MHDGPVTTVGLMREGRLRVHRADVFASELQQLRDGPVEIRITRRQATRSATMNAYYWTACVGRVASEMHQTPIAVHTVATQILIPQSVALVDRHGGVRGEYVIGGSTSKLTREQFRDYLTAFKRWVTEDLNMRVPDFEERSA